MSHFCLFQYFDFFHTFGWEQFGYFVFFLYFWVGTVKKKHPVLYMWAGLTLDRSRYYLLRVACSCPTLVIGGRALVHFMVLGSLGSQHHQYLLDSRNQLGSHCFKIPVWKQLYTMHCIDCFCHSEQLRKF